MSTPILRLGPPLIVWDASGERRKRGGVQQLPWGKPWMTGTCPPHLTDSKDNQVVILYFWSNLCGLSIFPNTVLTFHVPMVMVVLPETMPIGSWVSKWTRLHPVSSSRSIFSRGRDVLADVCVTLEILHEWVVNTLHNLKPGGPRCIL